MIVKEIRQIAKNLGIKPGKMNKMDLIRAIQIMEGNQPCFQTRMDFCDQANCCWLSDCIISSREN